MEELKLIFVLFLHFASQTTTQGRILTIKVGHVAQAPVLGMENYMNTPGIRESAATFAFAEWKLRQLQLINSSIQFKLVENYNFKPLSLKN